jgi:hypothetical protein
MPFLMSNIHQRIKANIEKLLDGTYNDLNVPEHVSEMQAFFDYTRSQNTVQKQRFFRHRNLSHGCQHTHKNTTHL